MILLLVRNSLLQLNVLLKPQLINLTFPPLGQVKEMHNKTEDLFLSLRESEGIN